DHLADGQGDEGRPREVHRRRRLGLHHQAGRHGPAAVAHAGVAAVMSASGPAPEPVARPSVLLVDDRPENLLALTAVLEPLEVRLVTAGSGEEALRALLAEDFAVVLLDVRMPGMDGYETAEYIRGRERSARTPIIFLTAVSTDVSQVLRGYEAGAVDYVLKPFDPVVLRSKVAVFAELERHRRGRERADELLRRAWESSPTGMVLVDDAGRIVQSNPAFGAVVGPDAAGVGSDLASRFQREDRPALVGLCQRVLVTGDPDTCELRLTAADGDAVPVAVVGAAVRDALGDTRSVLLQVEDLRPRRAAEAAIERAAAERAARDEAEALAGRLARVAAITDGLDAMVLSELVQELCRRLHEVLGARGAAVRVVDPGGAVVADAERGSADVAGRALRQALADGRGVVELDDGTLAVPLRAGGELFGAVAVTGTNGRTPEGQRTALVAHAAERAALIIRRALLLEREQHVASTLQHDLLPQSLPDLPGVSLAAHFRAGGHGIEVGGDWYDVIPLAGGRVGLVVGDVAGRGVAAAARMGQLRSVARAYALEGHAPAAFAADERLPPRPEPGRAHDARLRGDRARRRPAALRQRRAPAAAARPGPRHAPAARGRDPAARRQRPAGPPRDGRRLPARLVRRPVHGRSHRAPRGGRRHRPPAP